MTGSVLALRKVTTTDFTSQISDKLGPQVASGSFGDVYRCSVMSSIGPGEIPEVQVAVKVFKIDHRRTTDKLTNAMLRELMVWLRLKHPNILPLLGTARVEGSPLLALVSQWMPWTLLDYLEKQATTITTPSARHALVMGIAEGLGYLHTNDIIHGDFHPGNILIDDTGNPCIMDFGLATVVGDSELQWGKTTAERSFNSRWRAPEVLGIHGDLDNPERPTFKSDVYSFGGMIFFIISGEVPWKGLNSCQISIQLSNKATHLRPQNIFDYHWNLIQECWSLEPGDRPNVPGVLQVLAEYQQETSTSYVPLETTLLGLQADTEQHVAKNLARMPSTQTTRVLPVAAEETSTSSGTLRTASLAGRADAYLHNTITKLPASMSTKNIVLFGQTGAGKSSIVNLMAGYEVARTSAGTERCTMYWEEFPITFNKHTYMVFDTIGMDKYQPGMEEYLDAVVNTYTLIEELRKEGGIHLLLFCIRAGSFTSAIQNNYRLFYECLCQKKVPIVLVVTGLETEHRMEDWWDKSKSTFDKYGIKVDGHVCITAASGLIGRHKELYEQSRQLVCNAVMDLAHSQEVERGKHDGWEGGEGWFEKFISILKEFLGGNVLKQKQMVTVLTKRCGMPREAAVQLAKKVKPKLKPST